MYLETMLFAALAVSGECNVSTGCEIDVGAESLSPGEQVVLRAEIFALSESECVGKAESETCENFGGFLCIVLPDGQCVLSGGPAFIPPFKCEGEYPWQESTAVYTADDRENYVFSAFWVGGCASTESGPVCGLLCIDTVAIPRE